jgi:hypothetical protein
MEAKRSRRTEIVGGHWLLIARCPRRSPYDIGVGIGICGPLAKREWDKAIWTECCS